jgi:peptidoglycan/xylan/chitin deacetylase (PgdA/CDA1 family)
MRGPIVVYYHHIADEPQPDHWFFRHSPTFETFQRGMRWLQSRYVVISVTEMAEKIERGLPFAKRSVVITFDDGFRSDVRAAEVLHELSIPACFFVTVATVDSSFVPMNLRFVDIVSSRSTSVATRNGKTFDLSHPIQSRKWFHETREELSTLAPDTRETRLAELQDELGSSSSGSADRDLGFVSSDDLRRMKQMGMTIGCHSQTHDNMARCSEEELVEEMVRSKERLESMLDDRVDFFSYPDGRLNRTSHDVARRHYRIAFATETGGSAKDPWSYPRRGMGSGSMERTLSSLYDWRLRSRRCVKRILGVG